MKMRNALPVAAILVAGCASAGSARPALAARAETLETGVAFYKQGKYADAERVFRSVEGLEARGYLAASLAHLNKFGEALPIAEDALKQQATQPMAAAALGNCLVGQQKYDDAIARLSAIIAADAKVAYAYFWRGQAYQHVGQTERMTEDFETFLRLAPDAPEAASVQQVLSSFRR